MSRLPDKSLDAAIIGGGIAGIWLLNLLQSRGYRCALFESGLLGAQQTLASQGIIHGGLKYALGGKLTRASEAIAHMPKRWRACLAGKDDVDLRGMPVLSEHCHLFSDESAVGRLSTFFASKALRGRVRRLPRDEFPHALQNCSGGVFELADFVVAPHALLEALLAPVAHLVYQHECAAAELRATQHGWQLSPGTESITAKCLILAAGSGSTKLISELGLPGPVMQQRPLHQVLVRKPGLPVLYAHCLTGITSAEPRMTITSHQDGDGWLWCIGGQLAGEGAALASHELTHMAQHELRARLPWMDWSDAAITTFSSDRTEVFEPSGKRPDEAYATLQQGVIVCSPGKLTLAPDLGDRVLQLLPAADITPTGGAARTLDLPFARLGLAPWENADDLP